MSDDRVFCRMCTCERCRRNYTDKFCSICCFESGNAFIDDLIANSFDDLLNSFDHPPQHQTHSFNYNLNYGYLPHEPFVYNQDSCYEQNFVDNSQIPSQPQYQTNSCELCGNDAHYGYDCPPQEFLKKSPIAIAPVLPTEDPDNSLSMGDEHLDTILETKSDELIKSSVENLVPIPSESEDTLIVYSPKIDTLLEEFTGELVHIDPILPGIDETNSDPKDVITLSFPSLDDQMKIKEENIDEDE
nr:hypothetical protein [Tanacetum cinerariifolium]